LIIFVEKLSNLIKKLKFISDPELFGSRSRASPDPDPAKSFGSGSTTLQEAATNEVTDFRKAGLLDQLEDEKRKVEKLSGAAHQINGLQAALRYLQQFFLGATVALRYNRCPQIPHS
jgi:hypothetical protein